MLHFEDAAAWERETASLRALARRLLADEHAAEDAVQETWARALVRGPAHGEGLGRWMETVLRNLVRDGRRTGGRRTARESEVARKEALPSGAEIVERMELVQRLAAAVAQLAEPYRIAVHLRYFEGLSPPAIARRLGVPRDTVRTRLRRGLALLRERMDTDCGGRAIWAPALVPLAQGPGLPTALAPWIAKGIAKGIGKGIGGLVMSTKLKAGIAATVAAFACIAYVTTRDPEPAFEHDVAGVAPPSEPALEARPSVPREGRPLRPALPEPTRDAIDAPVAEKPPASEPPAERVLVTGRVTIVDADGVEHPDTSGELVLVVAWAPDNREERTIAFEQGRFTVSTPPMAVLGTKRIEANGRTAAVENQVLLVEQSREMEVRGEWSREGWLRVVDAETGAELSGIEVRRRWRWRAIGRALHPGDAAEVEVVAKDAASPVPVPGLPRKMHTTVAHWVRAPGYAWERIDLDLNTGGTRTVELARGGILRVEVVGARPDEELRIRAFVPAHAAGPSWDAAVDVALSVVGRASIADLQPGRYVVHIDRGEFAGTLTLGSAEAEVRADETLSVTVHIDPAASEIPKTHLLGSLTLPAGVEREGLTLMLSPSPWDSLPGQERILLPVSDLRPAGGDAQVLAWDAGNVRRGMYLAYVSNLQHRLLIDARNASDAVVDIVVPPLASLVASVVDGATGEALRANVMWADGDLAGVGSNSLQSVNPDPETGLFTITAPRGTIQVSASVDGYSGSPREVQLERDMEMTIVLERAAGARVSFWEGDARLPLASRATLKSIRDPETGADLPYPSSTSADAVELTLTLPPGRYRLEFEPPPGFRSVEPVVFEVPAREIVEVRVPLRK